MGPGLMKQPFLSTWLKNQVSKIHSMKIYGKEVNAFLMTLVPPPRHAMRSKVASANIPERPRAGTPMVACKAPFFIEHPDSVVTVKEGDDLVLTCRVGGDPKPRGKVAITCSRSI